MDKRAGRLLGLLGAAVLAGGAIPAAADTAELGVEQSSEHGPYLVDGDGNSLYLFESDSESESTCQEACAEAWPPLTTDGQPTAGEGVDKGKIGTFEREDGSTQVSYGGHPLYLFVRDTSPGDTSGHDVEGFGAEWYLVSPEGEKAGEH